MKPHKLTLAILTCIMAILCYTEAKIGYFWHISDFHYDPKYTTQGDTRKNCQRTDERGNSGHSTLGRFGNYACDSPFELIKSAAMFMKNKHPVNIEFILWTGDIVSRHYGNDEQRYLAIKKVTGLLQESFSSYFVFPALGHLDPSPSENLTSMWMHWLPLEALETFTTSGYYTIEQKHTKLRIVVLNTNLFGVRETSNPQAELQWTWLLNVLDTASAKKEMVYIVGHSAPGADSAPGQNIYSVESNDRYLKIIRKYFKIIAGQFFGHAHADTFRVFYDKGEPVSWALLAPSMSPHREPWGSSNPGVRLYKYDITNGKVLDYTQFYLELIAANKADLAEWTIEYNLTQYYGLHDINSHAFHNLAEKVKYGLQKDAQVFNRYIRAYTVKLQSDHPCDGACTRQHYCSITRLEYTAYKQCVEAAASALAAAAANHPAVNTNLVPITFAVSMFIVNLI